MAQQLCNRLVQSRLLAGLGRRVILVEGANWWSARNDGSVSP